MQRQEIQYQEHKNLAPRELVWAILVQHNSKEYTYRQVRLEKMNQWDSQSMNNRKCHDWDQQCRRKGKRGNTGLSYRLLDSQ